MAKLTPTHKTKEEIQEQISSNLITIGLVIAVHNDHHRLWYILANDNDLQQLYVEMYGRNHLFRIESAPTVNDMFMKIIESHHQNVSIEDCAFSISHIERLDAHEELAMLDITFTKIFQMFGTVFDFRIEIP